MQESKQIFPFYTEERWHNWIEKVKESGFKFDDDQDKGAVFVYMEDDVVLGCLKIIAKFDNGRISQEEALNNLADIKEIILKKVDPIEEDIDIMIESTQLSLMGVFASCECYIRKDFEKTKSFGKLIKGAIKAEEEDNMGEALGNVAQVGANILAGGKISEKSLDEIPEGLVAEWLDGIDSISAAMVGDTSYRDDEPDDGTG